MNNEPYKTYLNENELPVAWYNMRADMKKKPAPLLNPATRKPVTAEEPVAKDAAPENDPEADAREWLRANRAKQANFGNNPFANLSL